MRCRCDECRAWKAADVRQTEQAFREREGRWRRRDYDHGGSDRFVSDDVRLQLYERDNWTCQLCGVPVDRTLGPQHRMAATLDHIECQSWTLVPDHSPSNLRLAHRTCNSQRNNRPDW